MFSLGKGFSRQSIACLSIRHRQHVHARSMLVYGKQLNVYTEGIYSKLHTLLCGLVSVLYLIDSNKEFNRTRSILFPKTVLMHK